MPPKGQHSLVLWDASPMQPEAHFAGLVYHLQAAAIKPRL